MRDEKLIKLESDLQKVPGVRDARVVGVEKPSEIHIISTGARAPKQVVRDVQSLASAGYGLPIDHRIVSIVQLAEEPQEVSLAESSPAALRPVLDSVVFASKGEEGWVRVRLGWGGDQATEGTARFGRGRDIRALGAAQALVEAISSRFGHAFGVSLEDAGVRELKNRDVVFVECSVEENGSKTKVVGSAFIEDDVASAAVHAGLQALNRRMGRRAS